MLVVDRDDTLASIARSLGVPIKSLMAWNHLKTERVKRGQKLFYVAPVLRAESVGRPGAGGLVSGSRMPLEGRGYVMSKDRTRVFATPQTIRYVKDCLGRYRSQYPKGPPISLGDFSARNGGPVPPHVSHQSGRDVDIGFLTRPPQSRGVLDRVATPQNLDVEKQWFVLKCFLDNPDAHSIFIEWSVSDTLKAYVEKIYRRRPSVKQHYLRLFPSSELRIVKADSAHRTHMHVRFKCPKGSKQCVP